MGGALFDSSIHLGMPNGVVLIQVLFRDLQIIIISCVQLPRHTGSLKLLSCCVSSGVQHGAKTVDLPFFQITFFTSEVNTKLTFYILPKENTGAEDMF